MMMILLTEATRLLVPSHHDVAQDVLGEADGALELAGLVWSELELEHAVVPVTVVVDFVCETAAGRWRGLVDLAPERRDRALQALADRAKALFVGGGGHEVHQLVRTHQHGPFPGFAAGQCPGAERRRGTGPRRS